MRVLFLIPKNNPPQLTGNYSKPFKEFVEACLNKDPENVSENILSWKIRSSLGRLESRYNCSSRIVKENGKKKRKSSRKL